PAGQRLELIGVRRRQYKIDRIAADDSKRVDQLSKKTISLTQQLVLTLIDDLQPAQLLESLHRIRAAHRRMLRTIQQLHILNRVFDVDDSAGAVLHIDLPGLNQLTHLPPPQMERILPVPWSAAV